jgi:hypothetical protein
MRDHVPPDLDRNASPAFPPPAQPAASRPDPWAADLKPFKPYRYRGLGFDIFNPYEDQEDE